MKNLVLAAAFSFALNGPTFGQNESLSRGLVSGCVDAKERELNRPLTRDDKKFILNFCYCRAPGIAASMPDERSKQKMMLQDPDYVAAVQRINESCSEAATDGRRFYP